MNFIRFVAEYTENVHSVYNTANGRDPDAPVPKDLEDIYGHYVHADGEFLLGLEGEHVVAIVGLERISEVRGAIRHLISTNPAIDSDVLDLIELFAQQFGCYELVATPVGEEAEAFFISKGYVPHTEEGQEYFLKVFAFPGLTDPIAEVA